MVSRRDVTWAALTALLTFALFVATLRPDVGGTEDSPKFQFVGQVLGTAHTPGYPFYVVATYLFTRPPFGTLAYRVNLFSAVCGALACLCVFMTARRLGVSRPLSLAAALAAATSYPVWSNSVTAEVYTLAAVLSGFAVYFLIAFAQTGAHWRLYAACAMWAMGFGNHLTIVGILPAALLYGIYKDRSVLKPRVAITAAIIGVIGVAQYGFIALRTIQGAPYLEARATNLQGIYDVIIARDVAWARFYQAQSAVAAIELPMLLNGLRVHMGTATIVLVAFAFVIGIRKRHPELLLILGAAGGTLAMIANLWGDVVGFITPVCVQLWPVAAVGLQMLVTLGHPAFAKATVGKQANRAGTLLTAAGVVAMIVPVTNVISNREKIASLRTPGEGPGVRALYSRLPMRSALVAENYWLARLVNYMHFSNEISPDPNPRVLDSDAVDVRNAVADGLEVYAFEGATRWLTSQGLRFERTPIARQPFDAWLRAQPSGTTVAIAAAGRALPFEWLPPASRSQANRPSNFGVVSWRLGEGEPSVEQNDSSVSVQAAIAGRPLTITSSDDGPRIVWGDDVLAAIDRGLAVAVFDPAGQSIGQWGVGLDETPGVELPPAPYVLKGELPCQVLRPGQPTDVSALLTDGGWWATVEGTGPASIVMQASEPAATWQHRLSNGRGDASIDSARSRLILDPTRGTRAVFHLSMPPATTATATLEPGDITAVRVCEAPIPALPTTGSLEVTSENDRWFGAGWHLGERGGSQRFRWSQRVSSLQWRMEQPAPVRLLLHLRPAHANGATVQAAINGTPVASCAIPAGAWTDCRFDLPESALQSGVNQLTLSADTMSSSTDRPGDSRELAFAMQASRVRIGS